MYGKKESNEPQRYISFGRASDTREKRREALQKNGSQALETLPRAKSCWSYLGNKKSAYVEAPFKHTTLQINVVII